MRRRLLSIGILLLALLASAWGNVLAAAVCPHMRQDHACCHARCAHHPASHQGMMDMQTGDMQTDLAAEQKTEAGAFSQPAGSGQYCVCHSQSPPPTATLRDADQTKRGGDMHAPHAPVKPVSITASPVPTVSARGHAPPGVTGPARHVLISLFRI